uniref:Reverse transcriptase zinc-binding domain-containing protein n=1 Tax=Kalanchoe fedtschenkoi TaxID=63787 RepID=A0A7N0TSI8_KALFE
GSCVLCSQRDESCGHLFFECPIAKDLLVFLLNRMDISENIGQNYMDLTFLSMALAGSSMRKIAARAAVNLVVYHIWRERNARIFRDEVKDLQRLKIEALQEMNMILRKITRMKITQRNVV